MKPTLDWLADFVDLPTSDPEEIAAALDILGLKVESWEPLQQRLSCVVLGRVADLAGTGNVLVGSDYPLLEVCRTLDQTRAAGLAPDVEEAFLSGNAARLLSL